MTVRKAAAALVFGALVCAGCSTDDSQQFPVDPVLAEGVFVEPGTPDDEGLVADPVTDDPVADDPDDSVTSDLPQGDVTANKHARVVLHYVPQSGSNTCSSPQSLQGFDCETTMANTNAPANTLIEVYVYLIGYDTAAGIQLNFDWDSSWNCLGWIDTCPSNPVQAVSPCGSNGECVVAFDWIRHKGLVPIGRLLMISGNTGTFLTVSESSYPGGTGVLSAGEGAPLVSIEADRRGSIGAGVPGVDTCQP